MADASLAFDHVHLISKDPQAAAGWYVENLGGELVRSATTLGAPQIHISFGGAMIIVRGQRPAELASGKSGLEWGIDHFGLQVKGDFDAFCAALRAKGATFSLEPTDFNATTRIAFVNAPDGVSIELLCRKAQP
jgi:catechol 2,3-dioxygenase-like lactoylglutathione lyase family enzyme